MHNWQKMILHPKAAQCQFATMAILSGEHFATQLKSLSVLGCLFSTMIGHMFTGEPEPHKNASPAQFQDRVQKSAKFTWLRSSVLKHTKTF